MFLSTILIYIFKILILNIYILLKYAVFWDMRPCGSCKNRGFGGIYHFRHQGGKNGLARSNVSIAALMMEAIRSSETLVLTRPTRRKIREDGIFHSNRRENLNAVKRIG
jgi:hypothetical protein